MHKEKAKEAEAKKYMAKVEQLKETLHKKEVEEEKKEADAKKKEVEATKKEAEDLKKEAEAMEKKQEAEKSAKADESSPSDHVFSGVCPGSDREEFSGASNLDECAKAASLAEFEYASYSDKQD